MRTIAEIKADQEALDASDKKNPAKKGQLKTELNEALEAENRALRAKIESAPAPMSVDVEPDWTSAVDLDATPGSQGVLTDAQLIDRALEQRLSDPKPIGDLNILWNSLRKAVLIRRELAKAAGFLIPGEPVSLPAWSTLNLDRHEGTPLPVKVVPVPVAAVPFETEALQLARETLEEAEREAMNDAERADRIAGAIADSNRGQIGPKSAHKQKNDALAAKLAAAGVPAGGPAL